MPYPHRHLQKLSKLFDTIFLFRKAETKNSKVRHLMWPRDLREGFERLHEVPKERFLAMINNNCTPHGDFKRELYSERLRAIKYFSSKEGFDLWGGRWDRLLFFPHWNKFGAVKKSWRGYIEGDKLEMLAKYKFAIAFENSSYPGYVSEKIFDCFLTGVVPVYLGAPDVTEYVPKDCFIDMREFKTYADLEKYLRAVPDRELVLYRERFIKYLYSVKDTIFSKRLFAEKIWNALG
ncbi:hypothetical protein HY967_00230 [Candidatus Jorgensenbacteria bacterium]|nr:hypothetical protein [Candidatus Jorgensenbacteria bacterium]